MNTYYSETLKRRVTIPDEPMYFIGRADGYLYGYPADNDKVADWIGNEGTPIKMTWDVAKKLLGEQFDEYTLVEAR